MIPISAVHLGQEVEDEVLAVLRSGRLAQGPRVEALEAAMAELAGVRHAIAVNNGTTSLVASLELLGVGPGDEVVTSPFTFVATLNAILEIGAAPVFADIVEHDFTLDPAAVEAAVTARTRAIMPVHLYGQMADMAAISRVAERHGIPIIEDAAQAHGAEQGGRRAGSFGLGSFSFYATKNITTGEGGVITTDDDELARRGRILRNQGMSARYVYDMAGHNYRMTDLQAALALPQFARYGDDVAQRAANAAALTERLAGVLGVVPPVAVDGRRHVWHQYTVRVTPESGTSRDLLAEHLADRGVGSGIYYPRLVFDYPIYRERPEIIVGELPVASRVVGEVLSLPVHPGLAEGDLDVVADAVRSGVGAGARP